MTSFLTAEVDHRNTRRAQLKNNNSRNVSSTNTQKTGNYRKNKNGGKGKGNDKDPFETVDGKRIYGRHYPPKEFQRLTDKQKDAVKRLRKNKKNNGGNNQHSVSQLRSEFQDSMSQMEERIIAGVAQASRDSSPQDSLTIDDNTDSGSKRPAASSGQIGGYFSGSKKSRRGGN